MVTKSPPRCKILLQNLSCQSTAAVKLSILGHFASAEALTLLSDADEYLFAKMLSLYRNLYCQDASIREPADILGALSEQSYKNAPSVLEMIKRAFESHFSAHTKVLYFIRFLMFYSFSFLTV